MKQKKRTAFLAGYFPPELKEWVLAYAKANSLNQTDVIEQALIEFIEKFNKQAEAK